MNKDNVNQILDALAARLSVPASHLWQVLVRQAHVYFLTNLIGGLLAFVPLLLVVVASVYAFRNKDVDDETAINIAVWGGIFSLILAGFGVNALFDAVGYYTNPEFYALQEILKAFK